MPLPALGPRTILRLDPPGDGGAAPSVRVNGEDIPLSAPKAWDADAGTLALRVPGRPEIEVRARARARRR